LFRATLQTSIRIQTYYLILFLRKDTFINIKHLFFSWISRRPSTRACATGTAARASWKSKRHALFLFEIMLEKQNFAFLGPWTDWSLWPSCRLPKFVSENSMLPLCPVQCFYFILLFFPCRTIDVFHEDVLADLLESKTVEFIYNYWYSSCGTPRDINFDLVQIPTSHFPSCAVRTIPTLILVHF
jgi:hypothetical protein